MTRGSCAGRRGVKRLRLEVRAKNGKTEKDVQTDAGKNPRTDVASLIFEKNKTRYNGPGASLSAVSNLKSTARYTSQAKKMVFPRSPLSPPWTFSDVARDNV